MSEDLRNSEVAQVVQLNSNRLYGHWKVLQSGIRQGSNLHDPEINDYIEEHR